MTQQRRGHDSIFSARPSSHWCLAPVQAFGLGIMFCLTAASAVAAYSGAVVHFRMGSLAQHLPIPSVIHPVDWIFGAGIVALASVPLLLAALFLLACCVPSPSKAFINAIHLLLLGWVCSLCLVGAGSSLALGLLTGFAQRAHWGAPAMFATTVGSSALATVLGAGYAIALSPWNSGKISRSMVVRANAIALAIVGATLVVEARLCLLQGASGPVYDRVLSVVGLGK
jgi:hypothetical protein